MTERESRTTHITLIDQMMRELAWHAQKQAMHTLTRPNINVTLPQMITLFAIHERGACRMSSLAEVTQQSPGTLTGIVDRLIEEGLVARARNMNDRRVVEVMLTDAGQQRLSQIADARYQDTRHLLEQFSDTELTKLGATFKRLLGSLRGQVPSDGSA